MKILILGYGAVGSVLADMLSREKSVGSVTCADIRVKDSEGRISLRKADLSDRKSLMGLMKKAKPDIAVNSASIFLNKAIMECCLECGVDYMDVGSAMPVDRKASVPCRAEQLDYDKAFRAKGLKGLINAGMAPGLSNLLVRRCADSLEGLESVKVRLLETAGSKDICFPWSKECIMDGIRSPPVVYRNGRFILPDFFSEEEEYEFPKPFGRIRTALICHDESVTLPLFIKMGSLDVMSHDVSPDLCRFLAKSGLLSDRKMPGSGMSPFELVCRLLPDTKVAGNSKFRDARFCIAVEAAGQKSGRKKTVRYFMAFPKQGDIEKLYPSATFISYPTALSMKPFILSFPEIKERGVFPPECLGRETRSSVLQDIEKAGIRIQEF
jgi:saccharopine dehydrogenase-like NADP-dependent oxidoreductase